MFRFMARRARTLVSLSMVLSTAFAAGCAAGTQTPRAVVDQASTVDTPTSDASPGIGAGQKAESEDVEPVPVAIPGSDLVEAKATVKVNASLDKARATVLKFEDYPQFMPEYSDAKRLGTLPSGNEKVYMEITTLGGVAKMYANIEVLNPAPEGTTEVHEAKFLDGNVRQFKAIWTLTKLDDAHTQVALQVFLHPALPLPDFLVNKANLDGAKKGALAMKRRIESAR